MQNTTDPTHTHTHSYHNRNCTYLCIFIYCLQLVLTDLRYKRHIICTCSAPNTVRQQCCQYRFFLVKSGWKCCELREIVFFYIIFCYFRFFSIFTRKLFFYIFIYKCNSYFKFFFVLKSWQHCLHTLGEGYLIVVSAGDYSVYIYMLLLKLFFFNYAYKY